MGTGSQFLTRTGGSTLSLYWLPSFSVLRAKDMISPSLRTQFPINFLTFLPSPTKSSKFMG